MTMWISKYLKLVPTYLSIDWCSLAELLLWQLSNFDYKSIILSFFIRWHFTLRKMILFPCIRFCTFIRMNTWNPILFNGLKSILLLFNSILKCLQLGQWITLQASLVFFHLCWSFLQHFLQNIQGSPSVIPALSLSSLQIISLLSVENQI